ncbi:beta-microseminoprotein isoform X2 [Sapajus apella]|uniref:Beta-microseminoprotein isoform X2 n=1 Tax=Sapajus apella TaxID=9515 RepID=A0A6J3GYA7_SAPAP|nr:beta-microseminoprotein isoform X2 [Sapajus apella]
MNVLLGRLVILATFVTLCNASCYLIPNKIVPGESTKVLLYLWDMTKTTARKSSSKRTASILWWRRRTQITPVMSPNGYRNVLLVGTGLPGQASFSTGL